MAKLRRIRYADVMSTLAAFVALGGVGYAAVKLPANSVSSKQIKKGAVRSSDVKDRSLRAADFRAGVLPPASDDADGSDGANGSDGSDGSDGGDGLTGPPGPAGPEGPRGYPGIEGPQGPPGENGTARAYALVDPTCPGSSCTFSRSKGITSVTRVATGNYCVTAPGISSDAFPAYAAVEFMKTASPRANASAVVSTADDCPSQGFLVITRRMLSAAVKGDPGGSVTALTATDQAYNDIGFVVLIP